MQKFKVILSQVVNLKPAWITRDPGSKRTRGEREKEKPKREKGEERKGEGRKEIRREKGEGKKEIREEKRRKGERTMFYPCPTCPCLINLHSYNVSFCSWHTVCTQAAAQDPDQKPELQASLGDHERVLNFALAQPSL